VLSAALAYRLWKTEGDLPHYEQGSNARRIQDIGVPGLTVEAAHRELRAPDEARPAAGEVSAPEEQTTKR
jgi:hypothetical protein